MSYTTYDFSESLSRVGIKREDIQLVIAAWGVSGDCAEWSGGFLLKMKDGRFAYITGWCDTTGWGCQDGANLDWYDMAPEIKSLNEDESWDIVPADLNLFVTTGKGKWE